MSEPLNLSLSKSYALRLAGIQWRGPEGSLDDPRETFTPQFQLLPVGSAAFGDWATGTWETDTVSTEGPFAAQIVLGVGQAAPVNPAEAGVYRLWVQYYEASGETPAFPVGIVNLAAP
jgi:hypothetical protein